MGAGEVAVQHHHVVAVGAETSEGVVAVERHVDDHPVAPQPGRDCPGQPLVVFSYQHSHRLLLVTSVAAVVADAGTPRERFLSLTRCQVAGHSEVTTVTGL